MLPSAHVNRVGVRVVSFRGSMATPPILYLRLTASLGVAAQDSRPSGSLLLSCKASSSSASCRFSPAHCIGDLARIDISVVTEVGLRLVLSQVRIGIAGTELWRATRMWALACHPNRPTKRSESKNLHLTICSSSHQTPNAARVCAVAIGGADGPGRLRSERSSTPPWTLCASP